MNDDLRTNLSRLDPMHSGVPTESPTTPSSRNRLERVMSTNLREQQSRERPRRQPWIIAAASVAAASLAIVGVLSLTGNPGPSGPPLTLSLGEGDAMSSCLPFEVGILAGMPMAFEGTATAVDGDRVTLTVDHWYTGGDAAEVSLTGPAGLEALIGGITFEAGRPVPDHRRERQRQLLRLQRRGHRRHAGRLRPGIRRLKCAPGRGWLCADQPGRHTTSLWCVLEETLWTSHLCPNTKPFAGSSGSLPKRR